MQSGKERVEWKMDRKLSMRILITRKMRFHVYFILYPVISIENIEDTALNIGMYHE